MRSVSFIPASENNMNTHAGDRTVVEGLGVLFYCAIYLYLESYIVMILDSVNTYRIRIGTMSLIYGIC